MRDSDLIARCQRGEAAAFRQLYDQHVRLALRTAYAVTRDHALAEDAVQEAFVRVFGAIKSVDPDRSFGPWLTRIVVNEAIRAATWRARGGQPGAVPDLPATSSTEQEAGRSDLRSRLWDSLSALPPALRALVTLKYYREMTDPEIAKAMDCPVGTVKTRLSKARRLLRAVCLSRGLDLHLDT